MGKESIDLANLKIAEMREYGLRSQWINREVKADRTTDDRGLAFKRFFSIVVLRIRLLSFPDLKAQTQALPQPTVLQPGTTRAEIIDRKRN
jgi:hypothetical protein